MFFRKKHLYQHKNQNTVLAQWNQNRHIVAKNTPHTALWLLDLASHKTQTGAFLFFFHVVLQVINLPLTETIPVILHEWFSCSQQNW